MADEYELSPNERLRHAVMEAISRSEPIRASSLGSIRMKAADGKVELQGIIASEALRYVAEQLACAVPGVESIVNHLVTPAEMERRVALALASDESTRHQRIAVRAVDSVVTLYGAVGSQGEADMIAAVAGSASDGMQIHNRLQILPSDEPVILMWQNSLEGRGEAAAANPPKQPASPASEPSPVATPSGAPPTAQVGGTA